MAAPETKSEAGRSAEKAAATLSVSARSVESAAKVLRDAPALAPLVDSGKLAVSTAAAAAALPPVAHDAFVAQVIAAETPAQAKIVAQEVLKAQRVERKPSVVTTAKTEITPAAPQSTARDLARNDDREVDVVDEAAVFQAVDAMVDSETRELLEHLDDLAAFDPAWAEQRRGEAMKALAGWSARRASVA